jgi:VanZ family protein
LTLKVQHPAAAEKPRRAVVYSFARALAWFLSIVIVALSLAPPSLRPVTAAPHKLEHFTIFLMWGLTFGVWNRAKRTYQMVAAVFFAGAIEIAQYWVPGRHARISDFVVDAAAACLGIFFAGIFAEKFAT